MGEITVREWIIKEKKYHNNIAKSRVGKNRFCWNYFEFKHLFIHLRKRLELYKSPGETPKLLDFGCAEGNQLKRFLDQRVYGYKYYGTDTSDKLMNIAQENNPDGIFMITNGQIIPYESNFFNFVVCLGVLHHVPDVSLTVSEIIRVTKPGGYIYIREPMWIKPGKGNSPFERGIQFSEIADLISENKVNILACSFSHNSLLFFLINHLLPLKIGLSLGFWKIVFIVDTFINKVLVNQILSINFYKKLKVRPACFNIIVQKEREVLGILTDENIDD